MYTRMYILCTYIVVVCLVTKSCPTLLKPHGYSPPGSSVHGIFQAKMLEWVAILSPGDLPNPGIKPMSPALASVFFIPWKPTVALDSYHSWEACRHFLVHFL